jgi:hypothetical protein
MPELRSPDWGPGFARPAYETRESSALTVLGN